MNEKRSRGKQEKSMLREVVKPDEGWRGLEDRLKAYIKLEDGGSRSLCAERFKALQAYCKPSSSAPSPPLSPEHTLVTSTQPSKITSTPKHTTVPKTKHFSPMIIRKSPRLVTKGIKRTRTVIISDLSFVESRQLLVGTNCKFQCQSELRWVNEAQAPRTPFFRPGVEKEGRSTAAERRRKPRARRRGADVAGISKLRGRLSQAPPRLPRPWKSWRRRPPPWLPYHISGHGFLQGEQRIRSISDFPPFLFFEDLISVLHSALFLRNASVSSIASVHLSGKFAAFVTFYLDSLL
ncbi:hypothetical protein KSP40_PGU012957 [Platanthera guangdongensis]|uniref:Uncharacterized protein n=1 Tax=Platanthera guangdongensis TaxID=2320717 RepID=A0ABR2ME43_9ASPA